jgi:hypothetical protein
MGRYGSKQAWFTLPYIDGALGLNIGTVIIEGRTELCTRKNWEYWKAGKADVYRTFRV